MQNLRKRPQAPFWLELGKHLIDAYSYQKRAANQVPALEPTRNYQAIQEEGQKKECVQCKKHRKAIQLKRETSANSEVLHYAKCGALPIIIAKQLIIQINFTILNFQFFQSADHVNTHQKIKVPFTCSFHCTF